MKRLCVVFLIVGLDLVTERMNADACDSNACYSVCQSVCSETGYPCVYSDCCDMGPPYGTSCVIACGDADPNPGSCPPAPG